MDLPLLAVGSALRARGPLTSLLIAFAFGLWPGAVHAQSLPYCAQRISWTVLTGSQCFGTLAEAEAFLRTEPSPVVGNALMEQVGQTPLGLNRVQNQHARATARRSVSSTRSAPSADPWRAAWTNSVE